ncbi:hypothetical protein ACIBBE_03230 [Streptomyces sp. NPDC051644]|uniref:hypothetical protein n=1 Tax=Streptomyces sp. NPDC051644 TaxID=3365666 RepID=UPI0037A62852
MTSTDCTALARFLDSTSPWAGGQVYNQGVGGVDFSKSPKRSITRTRFNVENRTLDTTTKTSLKSDDTSYRDTDILYMGSDSVGDTGGGDGPTPTPTPTPTHPKPTDPPSTPAPSPSHPAGGDHNKPTLQGKDPEGDLAHTGSDTPVGLLSTLAAAIVAAGGALVWWMRRRRTGTSCPGQAPAQHT